MAINLIAILIYFIILFLIGSILSRKETLEGFLIADRKVRWLTLSASISAGFVGGGFIAGVISWSFLYGFSVMWIIVGMPIGFLLLMLFSNKIKKLSDEERFYTFSDFIYSKLGKNSGILSSFIIFIYFFAWLLLQFVVGGLILSSISGLSYFYSVLIMDIVILIYLYLAGFKAVVRTDLFQFLLILILLGSTIVFFSNGVNIETSQLSLLSGTGGIKYILGFLIIGIFVTMMSGDVWQRIYAAKTKRDLKLGLIGAAVIMLIIGTIITLIGVIIKKEYPSINSEEAIIYGFKHILPSSFMWIGLVVLFSSLMSTADTLIFALSMSISRNFIYRFRKIDDKSLVRFSRFSIIFLCLLSFIIAIRIKDVSNLYLWLSINILAIAPAVVLSLVMKLKKNASFLSILVGFISFLILNLLGKVNFGNAIIPFCASAGSLIIFSIILKDNSN